MMKYYKTPDVIFTDREGNAYCTNGLITIDTSLMSEESNVTALRLINALGFIKCSKVESRSREVPTPAGIIEYTVMDVITCPKKVEETKLGVFIIDEKTKIDTNVDAALLGQWLYCE